MVVTEIETDDPNGMVAPNVIFDHLVLLSAESKNPCHIPLKLPADNCNPESSNVLKKYAG